MKPSLACVCLALAACSTSAGGPEYIDLAVSAVEDTGQAFAPVCTPMPLMPGGHAVRDITFDGAFTVHVDARRDRIAVTVSGVTDPEAIQRTLPRATLERGYSATDLQVETSDGRRFTVSLASPCGPDTEM